MKDNIRKEIFRLNTAGWKAPEIAKELSIEVCCISSILYHERELNLKESILVLGYKREPYFEDEEKYGYIRPIYSIWNFKVTEFDHFPVKHEYSFKERCQLILGKGKA